MRLRKIGTPTSARASADLATPLPSQVRSDAPERQGRPNFAELISRRSPIVPDTEPPVELTRTEPPGDSLVALAGAGLASIGIGLVVAWIAWLFR